jgi:hypothetical protein
LIISNPAQDHPPDMRAGLGQVASDWFDAMYEDVAATARFAAVGIVTPDPASIESVLACVLMGTSLTHPLPFPWMSALALTISARGNTGSNPVGDAKSFQELAGNR